MIRFAAVAALLLAPVLAHAKAPRPPPPPEAPAAPEFPELPDLAPLPPMPPMPPMPELPAIPELDDLDVPGLIAMAEPRDADDRDDDDDAPAVTDGGVRVYRMKPPRIEVPHMRMFEGDEPDRRDATAQARGTGSATLQVKGPVTFQVRGQGGDLDVVTTDKQQVTVKLAEDTDEEIVLYAYGDRVEPSFRGRRMFRHGKLHVELPKGSRLDVSSMSGDITAQRLTDVRIRTMSGDVKLANVGRTEVQSISGDVRIDDTSGPVRLHLVSGTATVRTSGASPQLEFQSASGTLDWTGLCAKDCHLSAETVSGELKLAVDPKSSFALTYTSRSGELRDAANLAVKHEPSRASHRFMTSGSLEATYGKGEGIIEANAFSGNLVVRTK